LMNGLAVSCWLMNGLAVSCWLMNDLAVSCWLMNVFALRCWPMELLQAWGHHQAGENIGIIFHSIPYTDSHATNCECALVLSGCAARTSTPTTCSHLRKLRNFGNPHSRASCSGGDRTTALAEASKEGGRVYTCCFWPPEQDEDALTVE
jgi:hypothetical protein